MQGVNPEIQAWIELAKSLQAKGMKPPQLRELLEDVDKLLVEMEQCGLTSLAQVCEVISSISLNTPTARTPKAYDDDRHLDIIEGLLVSITGSDPYVPTWKREESSDDGEDQTNGERAV